MPVYLISLHKPDETVWQRLEEKWHGRHHIITPHMAILAPEDVSLTKEICAALGLSEEGKVSGFVVELTHYGGRANSSTIEWLEKFK
jgi:hypothetical protein